VLLLLFFPSGISSFIYPVVWVRQFGLVFGATTHTTSLVVAIFMLGLGTGSYVGGLWADRRYARAPESLLRSYGIVELLIAALGVAIALALPHLHALAARSSTYVTDPATGWFVLSPMSYVAQGAIALGLLGPSAILMGGTLTLLIRHLVRADVEAAGGWKIALLYAVNTCGAAAGAYLTDFVLVPAGGLQMTQFVAVALNVVAGAGALVLSRASVERPAKAGRYRTDVGSGVAPSVASGFSRTDGDGTRGGTLVVWTGGALLLSGFAAMGLEILWLRHFTLLLGGFRAVFSLMMTILLAGIGAGALAGGVIAPSFGSAQDKRIGPVEAFMAVQTLLVVAALTGLAANTAGTIRAGRDALEFWYNVRPMLVEIGLPSLLMGSSFPLANAVIQHAERFVGRRAGVLYLANTAGAVCGSLVTGYVLLPHLGMQSTATVLALVAGLTLAPLYLAAATQGSRRGGAMLMTVASVVVVAVAIDVWLRLPGSYLLLRSLPTLSAPETLVAVHEGVTEVVAITEIPGRGRALLTNGHAMSSTAPLDQRYMRAMAHIPLLSMDALRTKKRVLVIGFGVGNSTHAATLYPSVRRVDVADLSRDILDYARLFRDANAGVLKDPRVSVYVNDGRQHLQMQPAATYDLITLEPPPIAHAGVGALYSREFYELARTRLTPGGYLSQWLPAYQVPPSTALAMTRAFVDVFPQSVLLSGMQGELILVGTTAQTIDIDPERLTRALEAAPGALADLRRIDLGTVKEIVGTFVGSAGTLAQATRASIAVSDDRPLQEYGVRSALTTGVNGAPAALFDLPSAKQWCPRCFSGDEVTPAAAGLDTYFALLDEAYHTPATTARIHATGGKILGSAYLGATLPDTDGVHNIIGVTLLEEKRYEEAAAEFRAALKRREESPDANRNLGTALAAMGNPQEAIGYLQRAVQLAPDNVFARKELEALLR
jgi:spermidine synthase